MEQFRAFVFGHYDSRGGATLVRATNVVQAVMRYTKEVWEMDQLGISPEEEAEWIHNTAEDLMHCVNVVNLTNIPFGNSGTELDEGYGGLYHYGLAQYQFKDGRKKYYDIRSGGCEKTLLFWRPQDGTPELPDFLKSEWYGKTRVKRQEYGEDACGLVWVP